MGYQFGWLFHYAGPDGKFGRQHTRFITAQNQLGIDPNDPEAADDAVSLNELELVNHKATLVRVSSRDVIHGFALQQMRIQQDAIPGTEAPQWFRPIDLGKWQIICAQLCGTGHTNMAASYEVLDQAKFDAWYKQPMADTQEVFAKQREELKKLPADAAPEHHSEHHSEH
jgi:cytochrome c oxidase subunit 2